MNDHETLKCNGCDIGFENEPGEPRQIQDGLCNTCARPRLLEETKMLRGLFVSTCESRDAWIKQCDAAQARIDAAVALHGGGPRQPSGARYCQTCEDELSPCPTVKILQKEKPAKRSQGE